MKTNNKKIAVLIVTVVAVLVIIVALLAGFLGWRFLSDVEKVIVGNNINTANHEKGTMGAKKFRDLNIAIDEMPESENNDCKILYQAITDDSAIVFVQEKQEEQIQDIISERGKQSKKRTLLYSVIGYEFIVNDDGTYSYSGVRRCSYAGDISKIPTEYDWKTNAIADISFSIDDPLNKFENPRETYGVLPVWGVSDNEQVKNMTVDGQGVDEVIELSDDGETYYFWFIQDMQTRNAAKDIVIGVKE